jgi:transporter family-2 protein
VNGLVLLALFVGALLAVQTGVNARLGQDLRSPMLAALGSFTVGTLALLLYNLVSRSALPSWGVIRHTPLWAWTGGILGATYVAIGIFAIPRIGVGAFTALVVTGQLVVSVALDHFGLLGLQTYSLTWSRILGVALLISGVVLIRRS